MLAGAGTAAEDRRRRHLVALADSRAEPSLLERALARFGRRQAHPPAALDCCAVA
jgi:hypothetical protein